MFSWDEILILGDSFAGHRTEETDWPQQLAMKLTNESFDPNRLPRGQGFIGCALWSVRLRLYEEFKQSTRPKLAVFCHTDASRLPSNTNVPLNVNSSLFTANSVKTITKEVNDYLKISEACQQYYDHLYCEDFHTWAQAQWFTELDKHLRIFNVQTVHLHLTQVHNFNWGMTVQQPLHDLTIPRDWAGHNHFSIENNLKFANELYKVIENYTNSTQIRLNW